MPGTAWDVMVVLMMDCTLHDAVQVLLWYVQDAACAFAGAPFQRADEASVTSTAGAALQQRCYRESVTAGPAVPCMADSAGTCATLPMPGTVMWAA